MLNVRKILHPTDFSPPAQEALPHALFLAERFGAELHVLHASALHPEGETGGASPSPSGADPEMERLLAPYRRRGVSVVEVTRVGLYAAPIVLDYAREQDVDLIVMGLHGRRGKEVPFLGSVADEVLRLAPCPMLSLRQGAPPPEATERILVPVDFSAHSLLALAHGKELAALHGASIVLLHVVERRSYPAFYGAPVDLSVPGSVPELVPRAEAALGRFFDEPPGPAVPFETRVASGRPASEILTTAATEEVDLIVLATHGLTGLRNLLFGSTAEEVVRRAGCPVFTVRSFGKSLITGGEA